MTRTYIATVPAGLPGVGEECDIELRRKLPNGTIYQTSENLYVQTYFGSIAFSSSPCEINGMRVLSYPATEPMPEPDAKVESVHAVVHEAAYKPESYLTRHNASGFKVGDMVRAVRKAEVDEQGWWNVWDDCMDRFINRPMGVLFDRGAMGFECAIKAEDESWSFPHFVLEPLPDKGGDDWRYVDPAVDSPMPDDEIWDAGSEQWRERWHYHLPLKLEHIYRRKVTPQYRPFANAVEFEPFRDEWIKKLSFGQSAKPIAHDDDGFSYMQRSSSCWICWETAFKTFQFTDGRPFGMEVGE